MHAQSAQRYFLPVQTGDLMLTHLCTPNCCHGCLPAALTPTALHNFPPLVALGMLSLLENRRHRHPIIAEHWNHLCCSPAAEETAALAACLPGMGDSSRNMKVSHLAVLHSTAIAVCHISGPQQAVHVAQEEALPAAGWAEATPRPGKGRDGTGSTPHTPPAEARKRLLPFTTVSPKHN